MTNQQRRNIIKKCKEQSDWSNYESGKREVNQDKIIEKECILLGFTYSDFCNCDGKLLEKLFS
jgi:hypothetical protein